MSSKVRPNKVTDSAAPPTSHPDVRAEHRLPAIIGLILSLTLYGTLPSTFLPVFRFAVVGVGVVMLIPLIILNPHRLHRQTRWSRWLGVSLALLLVVANEVALIQLVTELVTAKKDDGPTLLLAALQVAVMGVISYALVFWELDRGGPVTRRHAPRSDLPRADFRFPQDEDHDAVDEVAVQSSMRSGWVPGFFDYVYFSASNSMAFSPTDAMPLSSRAKALMVAESSGAFILLALVIARAVSLLG